MQTRLGKKRVAEAQLREIEEHKAMHVESGGRALRNLRNETNTFKANMYKKVINWITPVPYADVHTLFPENGLMFAHLPFKLFYQLAKIQNKVLFIGFYDPKLITNFQSELKNHLALRRAENHTIPACLQSYSHLSHMCEIKTQKIRSERKMFYVMLVVQRSVPNELAAIIHSYL